MADTQMAQQAASLLDSTRGRSVHQRFIIYVRLPSEQCCVGKRVMTSGFHDRPSDCATAKMRNYSSSRAVQLSRGTKMTFEAGPRAGLAAASQKAQPSNSCRQTRPTKRGHELVAPTPVIGCQARPRTISLSPALALPYASAKKKKKKKARWPFPFSGGFFYFRLFLSPVQDGDVPLGICLVAYRP